MNKIPLIENACKELNEYGVLGRRDKCVALAKRLLLHRKMPADDPIFWTTGILAAGLWHCREELVTGIVDKAVGSAGEEKGSVRKAESCADGPASGKPAAPQDTGRVVGKIDSFLAAYYGRWQKKGMPLAVLDDLLAGETLLNIYLKVREGAADFGGNMAETEKSGARKKTGLSESWLKAAADQMALYAAGHPADAAGSFLYRPDSGDTAVFVDGIGLSCPFLYKYGEIFDRQEYKELAVLQIANYLSYGMDGETGLPYHGYDMKDDCKYGIIGWGRAVGWLLRGMAGCMMSDYGRERLGAPFTALVDAALHYQRQDGCFSWQLEALEGPADTSVTGMICNGLRQGLALGVLSGEKYENALVRGRYALERSVRDGRVYQCSGECEGFSRYPQNYGAFPWSLGPALEVLQADQV